MSENEAMHKNDFKYRLLKLYNDPLYDKKYEARTISDLTYYIDSYYHNNQKKVEMYVVKREEEIRQAYEASEIAKQKDAEALLSF